MAEVEQTDEVNQVEPLRMMLLGKSGVGKSSSGNTILGKQVFKSDMKLTRVTRCCTKELGVVENVPLAVIDTPGLFETGSKKDDVREILKCVKLQEPGPHVFVFVVPLGRMTLEDQDTNAVIEKMFGSAVWDYTIVLFTHGDRLEGKTINDVISESDENLRNFIRKCSGGFHVFNNKKQEDQEQVTSFVAKIQTLMALNGRGHYHTALYPEKERKIRERQEEILKEREAKISDMERALQGRYQGEELEKRKRQLWMKVEDKSRKEAEEQSRRNLLVPLLVLAIVGVIIAWAVNAPDAMLLGLIIFGMGITYKMFPLISKNAVDNNTVKPDE